MPIALPCAHGRTVYDALYIALGIQEDCQFVTADERLVNSVSLTLPHVVLLGAWSSAGSEGAGVPRGWIGPVRRPVQRPTNKIDGGIHAHPWIPALRKTLETTVEDARDLAEDAARIALERSAVDQKEAGALRPEGWKLTACRSPAARRRAPRGSRTCRALPRRGAWRRSR